MTSEFKIGDRVVCVDDKHKLSSDINMQIKSGEEYIINNIIHGRLGLISLKGRPINGAYFCDRFKIVYESYSPTQIGDKDDDI